MYIAVFFVKSKFNVYLKRVKVRYFCNSLFSALVICQLVWYTKLSNLGVVRDIIVVVFTHLSLTVLISSSNASTPDCGSFFVRSFVS